MPSVFNIHFGSPINNADAGLNPRWAVTDLSGDGHLDLALRFDPESSFSTTKTGASPLRFFIQQADGSFLAADLSMSANLSPTLVNKIVAGDFNHDGKGDLVIGASGQDPYLNGKPAGPWPGEISYVLESTPSTNYKNVSIQGIPQIFAHHLSVGDINGDGYDDIFVDSIWMHYGSTSYFLINDKKGGFSVERSMLPESVHNPKFEQISLVDGRALNSKNTFTASALFDANNDGSLDLAVLPMGGTDVGKVFLNDGSGNFSDSKAIRLPPGPYGAGYFTNADDGSLVVTGSSYLDAVVFDANGDGLSDLVSLITKENQNPSVFEYYKGAAVQILINTGNGFIDQSSSRTNFVHNPSLNFSHYDTINAVDIDADGFKDLLLYRPPGNADGKAATRILLNDGHGVFNEAPYPSDLPDGLLIPIDAPAGLYAVVEVLNKGYSPSTMLPAFVTKVDSVQLDWSQRINPFSGSMSGNPMASDIPGRWIHGSTYNDNIVLSSGSEKAYGYAGADSIIGGSGNDEIDGGDGLDLCIYSGLLNQYQLGSSKAGFSVADTKSSRDGADLLQNVERLRFTDMSVALDKGYGQIGGEAYRLYKAAFDRTPDLDGLASWINALDGGMSMTAVATRFLNSDEFHNKYGGDNPSNETLVTLLYKNVLHRGPDNSGYTAWVNALDSHDLSKEAVLIRFSESDENIKQTEPLIANGIQYHEWWLG